MVISCSEDPEERVVYAAKRLTVFSKVYGYLLMIVIVGATVYFYVIRAPRPKPRFIGAIFVLLNLVWPIVLSNSLIEINVPIGSFIYWLTSADFAVLVTLAATAHWIFAKNYFMVALNASIFIKQDKLDPREKENKQRKSACIIKTMDIAYYLVIVISVFFCFACLKDTG